MFRISGNSIYLTRGDTGRFSVLIRYKNGTPYLPAAGDVLCFTVKKSCSDSFAVIKKEVRSFLEGGAALLIEPCDTKKLRCGDYVYDVELRLANGDINTIITASDFKLCEEVG